MYGAGLTPQQIQWYRALVEPEYPGDPTSSVYRDVLDELLQDPCYRRLANKLDTILSEVLDKTLATYDPSRGKSLRGWFRYVARSKCKEVLASGWQACLDCGGAASDPPCDACGGKGRVRRADETALGEDELDLDDVAEDGWSSRSTMDECAPCRGTGEQGESDNDKSDCPVCSGFGCSAPPAELPDRPPSHAESDAAEAALFNRLQEAATTFTSNHALILDLHAAVMTLKPEYRLILLDELNSNAQPTDSTALGKTLGMTVGAVTTARNRCKQRLRDVLIRHNQAVPRWLAKQENKIRRRRDAGGDAGHGAS